MAPRSHLAARITYAVALIALLALAGCGEPGQGRAEGVTCTRSQPDADTPTAPGSLLCLGTAGNLPMTDDHDRRLVVRVTVTSVDRVPRAEVDGLTSRDLGTDHLDPARIDVYAVHAKAHLPQPAPLDPLREVVLYAGDRDYADPHALATWQPEGWAHDRFTADLPADSTIRTCDWVWVPRGAEVDGVTLGSEIDEYAVFGGNPVSWALPSR